jgi:uncharacterized repeat protein (TIGR01451 family)
MTAMLQSSSISQTSVAKPASTSPAPRTAAVWALVALILTVFAWATSASAQTVSPIYFTTVPDAVTGDNTPVTVNHPSATCPSTARCYVPDSNGEAGSNWVDNYSLDIWERPFGSGSSARNYMPWIDITQAAIGYDANFIYYAIDMYGTNAGAGNGLTGFYSVEINYDGDSRGDLFIRIDSPSSKVGTNWGTIGLMVWRDANKNVGGARPLVSDAPGGAAGGYENLIFDQGSNTLPGAPGGTIAVRARINPADPTIVEFAISRSFLTAANNGTAILGASFRPTAAVGSTNPNQFPLHDEYTRLGGGSPYPWLRLSGAPSTCPSSLTAENALTAAQRDALDSGTNMQTSFLNPCYPTSNIYELDNGGTVHSLLGSGMILLQVDVSVSKATPKSTYNVSEQIVYTVTVTNRNSGSGQATGVTVRDFLPAGTTFVSATASQGTCAHSSGTVTCSIGNLLNGASASSTITVNAPTSVGEITNKVTVTSNETDIVPANNEFNLSTQVISPSPLNVSKWSSITQPQGAAPHPIPGEEITYTIEVTNPGAAIDSSAIIITDPLPSSLVFYRGPFDETTTEPVKFVDGSPTSGLTCCTSAHISYSTDNGVSFSYLPPSGYDPAITHVRVRPGGGMPSGSSFRIMFRAKIK